LRDILRQNNADLLCDVERLGETLRQAAAAVPPELLPFFEWVTDRCDAFREAVTDNLRYIDLGVDEILPDVLSETQVITRNLHLFNRYLVSPVLRVRPSDRLCLKLLRWLHGAHPQTRHIPAAISDGDYATFPNPRIPTIYFMPPSAQHRLLYLALFFHEFGHLLYACHRPEMDALVRNLQKVIALRLEPSAQRDDRHSQREQERRSAIVETWYEWTIELFCDAVGLSIGGAAFAHSFSMFFRMRGRDEFQVRPEALEHSGHPVTWLRIRLLAERARQMGLEQDAQVIEDSWQAIARELRISEDYFGFYEPEFSGAIQQTITDMLTEANPRRFDGQEQGDAESPADSPVRLLDRAWQQFFKDAQGYAGWEKSAIAAYVAEAAH
jgi:hypothetical protein